MPRPTIELQLEYQREWSRRRKKERLELALTRLGGKCVECGTAEGLQFDHIDQTTKDFTISTHTSTSLVIFLREVDKCQLLCKVHHREKTLVDKGWFKSGSLEGRTHGKIGTYHNGCRCSECRRANADCRFLNKNGFSYND